jgi:hypothetical protein
MPDGRMQDQPLSWEICEKRQVPIKNMGDIEIREIIKTSFWLPSESPEERAISGLNALKIQGLYHA